MAGTVHLYSLHRILRKTKDGQDEEILPRTVFEATPTAAKQYDALKSARPATKEEIARATELQKKADGVEHAEPAVTVTPVAAEDTPKPVSVAKGDPNALPKKAS
jgi:hypothetical protein